MRIKIIFALLLFLLIPLFAIPQMVEYQGKLTDTDGIGVNAVLDMSFSIYDSQTGGTLLWTEDWTGVDAVDIEFGLFTVELGTHTTLDLDFSIQYFIEIEVDGTIMTPRVKLNSVPYAYRAAIADSVVGGSSGSGGGTLAEVLAGGNSTDNNTITDATDNVVDIDDNLVLTASHTLYVDNISPEGTSSDINFEGAIDMNGNYINNADATYMEGDVAFNDDIVPVNSAQDLGKDAHPWDDVFLGATSMININGVSGTSGQVLKVDASGNIVWGTDESSGSGTSEWNDAGSYKNVLDNDKVRAYETGAAYGYQVAGSASGTIDIAADFQTDWQASSTTDKIAVNAEAHALSGQDAYGIKALAEVYSGGGTGSNKYGVYGEAQYGVNNYGVYGANIGTNGMQYAIYGFGGTGEYAGYFEGNLAVTGTIEDSDGDVGTAGQVLSSTSTGTDWITASGSGSSLWEDAGVYARLIGNDDVRAYEAGDDFGFWAGDAVIAAVQGGNSLRYGALGYNQIVPNHPRSWTDAGILGYVGSGSMYDAVVGVNEGNGNAVLGITANDSYAAIYGYNNSTSGTSGMGVLGEGYTGVFGSANRTGGFAIYGEQSMGDYAGYFEGNVAIEGTLEDSDGDIGTAGQVLSSTATGINWIDPATATDDGDWTVSSTNMYSSVLGNVGIGTTTPTSKLHVYGDMTVTGRYLDSSGDAGGTGQILSSTSTGTNWIDAPSGGTDTDWTVSGTNIYSGVSGNVGIGTSSPTSKFHVNGNSRFTGSVLDASGDAGTSGQILSSTGTGTNWIDAPTGGTDTDWTISGTNIYSGVTGNVGIGTTSPATKLHVVNPGSGDIASFYAYGHTQPVAKIGDVGSAPGLGYMSLYYAGTSPATERIRFSASTSAPSYFNAGNVGIGTTAPSADLHVAGDTRITGRILDTSGDAGTSGQVLSSTVTGTNWIDAPSGSEWVDGGIFKNVSGNAQVRAYETGQIIGYEVIGTASGTINTAARFQTSWNTGVTTDETAVIADAQANNTQTAYGVNAYAGVYSGGGIGGNKYGVYGTAEWGTNNYGIYGTCSGTSGNQYAIYGDAAGGEYAGYFAGNVSIEGTLEDSDGDVGTSGQVLSSTGSGTNWIAASSGGTDNDWAYITGSDLTGDVYHTGDVAIGTDATDSHTLNVEGYNSGAAAIRGANQSGTSIYAEGLIGVLGYSGLPGTPYNIGVLGIKPTAGSDGAGVYALTLDDASENWALYAAATGAGTTNYGVYASATGATNNYAGYFSGDVRVTARIFDSSGDAGTAGQVLSSTGTGTNWIDASSGGTSFFDLYTSLTPNRIHNDDGYNLWLESTTSDPNRRIYFGDGSYCWVGENETDDRLQIHGSSLRIEHGVDGGTTGEALVSNGTNCTWQSVSGGGGVTGTGTSGYVPRWTGTTVLGNSTIRDNGSVVAINSTVNTNYRLYVVDDPGSGTGYFYDDAGETATLADNVWEGVDGRADSDDGTQGYTTHASYHGVYYSGGLGGSGDKSCIERTSQGPAALYCQESPESWFEDFGNNAFIDGACRVNIRDDFLEVIDISDESPLHVFISPNANIGNWWIEKDLQGFTVHAPDAPNGSTFDWRMVAHRIHYTGTRMKIFEASFDDPYLYPENMGVLPRETYEKLKGHEEDAAPYEEYRVKAMAEFNPHEASPWNEGNLPTDWKEQVENAKSRINITSTQNNETPDNADELYFDVRGNVIPAEWVEQLKEANYPMLTYEEARQKRLEGYLKEAKWMNEDPNEPKIKKDQDGNPIE